MKPIIPEHVRPYLTVNRYDPLVKLALESKGGRELVLAVKRAQEILAAKENLRDTQPAKHERCLRRLWQQIGFKPPYGKTIEVLQEAINKHKERVVRKPMPRSKTDHDRERCREYAALRSAARVFGLADEHLKLQVLPMARPSPNEFRVDKRGELPHLLQQLYNRLHIGLEVRLKAWRPVVLPSHYSTLNHQGDKTWEIVKARKYAVMLGGQGDWSWRISRDLPDATLLLCCRAFRISDGEHEVHVLDDWARDTADWSKVWTWYGKHWKCWGFVGPNNLPGWWRT